MLGLLKKGCWAGHLEESDGPARLEELAIGSLETPVLQRFRLIYKALDGVNYAVFDLSSLSQMNTLLIHLGPCDVLVILNFILVVSDQPTNVSCTAEQLYHIKFFKKGPSSTGSTGESRCQRKFH